MKLVDDVTDELDNSKAIDAIGTGWDSDRDVLNGIKDGWVEAVSVPNFSYMTQLAISILEAKKRDYLLPDNLHSQQLQLSSLPNRIDIQQIYVDKSNIGEFL